MHLKKHGCIGVSQHGSVQGRLCFTNFIEFFLELTKMICEHWTVDVIYKDFSKAFDKVPHGELLNIKAHWIHGDLVDWILNWPGHRRMRVVVEGVLF